MRGIRGRGMRGMENANMSGTTAKWVRFREQRQEVVLRHTYQGSVILRPDAIAGWSRAIATQARDVVRYYNDDGAILFLDTKSPASTVWVRGRYLGWVVGNGGGEEI